MRVVLKLRARGAELSEYTTWNEIFKRISNIDTTIGNTIEIMNSKGVLVEGFAEEINPEDIYHNYLLL